MPLGSALLLLHLFKMAGAEAKAGTGVGSLESGVERAGIPACDLDLDLELSL